ncbi:hypothetical protein BDR26DRAFT_182819 [Obelidium mucronatum]|nr:hypothetical protein BDR26DRAFT_182819 [Obelidium mucronatum]
MFSLKNGHAKNSFNNSSVPPASLYISNNEGCPVPQPALIGILSIVDTNNTARRNYLRHKYGEMNSKLPPSEKIDFKFIFGQLETSDQRQQLKTEQTMHPNDTVITNRIEGVNNGKSVDWFRIARNLVYIPHPTIEGNWCRKYLFVAKTDDDAVMSVPRASKLFRSLRSDVPLFVGHPFIDTTANNETIEGMHGMMYAVTVDLVEWMYSNAIPEEKLNFPEDQLISMHIRNFNGTMEKIRMSPKYVHDLKGPPVRYTNVWTRIFMDDITENTILVHYCKDLSVFMGCMANLFESPSTLVTATARHRLSKWQGIQSRSFKLGFNFTQNTCKHIAKASSHLFNNKSPITVKQLDIHLTHHFIATHLSSLGLHKVSENNTVVHKIFQELQDVGCFVANRRNSLGYQISQILPHYIIRMRIYTLLQGVASGTTETDSSLECATSVLSKLYAEGKGYTSANYNQMGPNSKVLDSWIGHCILGNSTTTAVDLWEKRNNDLDSLLEFQHLGFDFWDHVINDEVGVYSFPFAEGVRREAIERIKKLGWGERDQIVDSLLDTLARERVKELNLEMSPKKLKWVVDSMHRARTAPWVNINNVLQDALNMDEQSMFVADTAISIKS